jgi:hypothetical protein
MHRPTTTDNRSPLPLPEASVVFNYTGDSPHSFDRSEPLGRGPFQQLVRRNKLGQEKDTLRHLG